MQWFDPVFLSRIQFAFVISFHIIFPVFTIGLASWLMVLEFLWLRTKNPVYKEIYQHWVKIFSVSFGLGVVSGVVMSYQFGTNWALFMAKVGNVIGPLLAFEVLTAFFLEASFLGIMLFGWNRVGPRAHFVATCMVALGTLTSSFWILSVNSWMQTPTGYEIIDGIFHPLNWLDIIFNPSFIYRLMHKVLSAYLTTAFVVIAVASWYLYKNKFTPHARIMLIMGSLMAFLVTPLQFVVGHEHGVNTLEYQPAKVAAMEGIWDNETGANLRLFGYPNSKTEKTEYSLEIPKLASYILTGNTNSKIYGLKHWDKNLRPPVLPVFMAFRVMVGVACLMLLFGIIATYKYFKKTLFKPSLFHKFAIIMGPSGFIAVLSGWIVTEVGRQPFVVYNLLRTQDAASKISASEVTLSLFLFITSYTIIFGAGVYYIFKLIKKGPQNKENIHDDYGTHGLDHPITIGDIFSNKEIKNDRTN